MSNNAMEDTVIKMLIEKINSLVQMVETQKDCINRLADTCQKQQSMNDKLYDQLNKTTVVQSIQSVLPLVQSVPPSVSTTEVSTTSVPAVQPVPPVQVKPDLKHMCKKIQSVKLAATGRELFAIITLGESSGIDQSWMKYCNLIETSVSSSWMIGDCGKYIVTAGNKMSFAISLQTLTDIMPHIDVKNQCVLGVSIINQYMPYYIERITHNDNKFIIQLKTQVPNIVRMILCLRYDTMTPGADSLILHSPSDKFLTWGSDLINVKFN